MQSPHQPNRSHSRKSRLASVLRTVGLNPEKITPDQIARFAEQAELDADEEAELLALFCPRHYFGGNKSPLPAVTSSRVAAVEELRRRLAAGERLFHDDDVKRGMFDEHVDHEPGSGEVSDGDGSAKGNLAMAG